MTAWRVQSVITRRRPRLGLRLRYVAMITFACLVYILTGLFIYTQYYGSYLVSLESLLWLITLIAYLGKVFSLKVLASKRPYSRKRKLLSVESLTITISLFILTGLLMKIIYEGIIGVNVLEPIHLSLYLLASIPLYYLLQTYHEELMYIHPTSPILNRFFPISLSYCFIVGLGGSSVIILSNMLLYPIIENIALLIMGGYIITEYIILYYKMILQLLNKMEEPSKFIYKRVRLIIIKVFNPLTVKTSVRIIGEFAEVEIWIKAANDYSLPTLYAKIRYIAKRIMRETPYIIRVSIVVLVSKPKRLKSRIPQDLKLKKGECPMYTRWYRIKDLRACKLVQYTSR